MSGCIVRKIMDSDIEESAATLALEAKLAEERTGRWVDCLARVAGHKDRQAPFNR